MIIQAREEIQLRRVNSEREGLLHDVEIWKGVLPPDSMIRHHVEQFEQLCTGMFDRVGSLYDQKRWKLDEPTFDSLVINVLGGKWVLLRQAVIQRTENSPYLKTLNDLDAIAEDCYQRLNTVLRNKCGLLDLSNSSPVSYLGPIARIFLFDEEAPCLISTPFGAANESNELGQELCRQTIPHEAAHAIFEQIPGLTDELRVKTASALATSKVGKRLRTIHPVMLNWLDEVIADMAGTALASLDFARSASVIMTMPEKTLGITDETHPIPLLRPFIHLWTLQKTSPETAPEFEEILNAIVSNDQLDIPFESLPSIVSVSMREVRDELYKLVDLIWKTNLDTLNSHSLGEVFSAVAEMKVSKRLAQELPAWGELRKGDPEVVFRLIGPSNPSSPLPASPLYLDPICCPLKLQFCCSSTVM